MLNPTSPQDFLEGQVLLIDKTLHWTSFNVVKKIKNLLYRHLAIKKIKVGHAGTLDPLATGLLVVCTGKATKSIESIQNLDKTYLATIVLGKTTPSYDLETDIDRHHPVDHINLALINECTERFTGTLAQVPPIYSAKKLNGTRAYEFARQGQEKEMKASTIKIHSIDVINFDLPELTLQVTCSKGTYIRALARDIGESLKSGAYLKSLRRTKIGDYEVGDALTIHEFENIFKNM